MVPHFMHDRAILLQMCLLFAAASVSSADEVTAFGLRHTTLFNAALVENDSAPLRVVNTNDCDVCTNGVDFGVSIFLGSSDAGIFLAPNCDRIDGAAIDGF